MTYIGIDITGLRSGVFENVQHSALLNGEATIFRCRYYHNDAHTGGVLYSNDPNMTDEVEEEIMSVFRILCHVKNSTASSHYSVALQNKWLTATMLNSSSEQALFIFSAH